jgi:hypothetical protein
MPTSTLADSAASVREYVRNANAILDSLTRFEFTKQRYHALLGDYSASITARVALTANLSQARTDQAASAARLTIAETSLGQQRRKRRWSQVENWLWRAGASYWLYRQFRGR